MLGHLIREGPHHAARLGVAVGDEAVLDGDPLDATGEIGLPVLALGLLLLGLGQLIPPAELFHQVGSDLGIAVFYFTPLRPGVFGEQRDALILDAETGAETAAPFRDRNAGVVEDVAAGVLHLRGAPAGPGQTVHFATDRAALGLEVGLVEGVPVLLVRLEPLRALAGVAHAPHAAVVFAGDVFQQWLVVLYLDVLEQLVGKAELLAQEIHDLVVDLGFEQGLDHLVAPLHGAVGGGDGTIGLELGGGRQQVDAVGAIVHHRGDGGIRVDNHHHVELLHRLLHFRAAGLGVDRMTPVEHGADVGALLDEIGVLQHPVHPAGDRNAVVVHRQLAVVGLVVKTRLDPLVIDIPHPGPVLPGALFQPVVTGQ